MRVYADLFKALADETRLTIMALLLRHGELCVCDVEAVLKISQSKASRHLRYLKNAGLLVDRREGIWVYYKISSSAETEASQVLIACGELIASLLQNDTETHLAEWIEKKSTDGGSCTDTPVKQF